MDRFSNKKTQVMAVIVLCAILLILHAFFRFNRALFRGELESKQTELKHTAQTSISDIQDKYADMVHSLEVLAENISDTASIYHKSVYRQTRLLKEMGSFRVVGVSDQNGNSINSQNRKNNISQRTYFQEAMKGSPTVSDVMTSKVVSGKEIQVIAVPVKEGKNGQSKGIVFGILPLDTIHKILGNDTNGDIYIQIVDSDGNYVTRFKNQDVLRKHKNVWKDILEYEFLEGNEKKLKKDIKNHKSGYFSFRLGDEERVSYYAPLGLKDHYIFATSNSKYLKENTERTRTEVFWMSGEMGIAFLILIAGLYWYNKKVKEELEASHQGVVNSEEMMQIAIKETQQLVFEYHQKTGELRVKAGVKNGLFSADKIQQVPETMLRQGIIADVSLDDFGGLFERIREEAFSEAVIKTSCENRTQWLKIVMKNIYDTNHRITNTVGIVEDVTEKKYQEELLKEKQKIQDALNADSFMNCRVDLETGIVLEQNGKVVSEHISYRKYLEEFVSALMVENDWRRVIPILSQKNLIKEFRRGKEALEVEFQMLQDGKVIWVSCMIYLMEDERERHIQAWMIFNDIDMRKQQELNLRERAEKDGLTGLYNAATLKQKADEFLESLWAIKGNHIFLLLDLDNFKAVNDTFGHQYGDQVLKDAAQILKMKFRHDDLIGRLGGDEFVVMAFHTPGFSEMEHIFCELCQSFQKTYQKDGQAVTISASLGIAIAPKNGTTFEELYQKADQALYTVKRNQKNGYAFYDDCICKK